MTPALAVVRPYRRRWHYACRCCRTAPGADDARRGTRFQHADAGAPRVGDIEQSAGRLHDETPSPPRCVSISEDSGGRAARHSVGGGGRGALELPVFLAELVRCADEELRKLPLDDLLHALLVRRVPVRVQKQDRDRLHSLRDRCRDHSAHLGLVELDQHRALGVDALVDLEAQVAIDQRNMPLEKQVVGLRPVDAADLVNIAEALRRQQRAARAAALQNRVDRDGGAVEEKPRRLEAGAGPGNAVLDSDTRRDGVVSVLPSSVRRSSR